MDNGKHSRKAMFICNGNVLLNEQLEMVPTTSAMDIVYPLWVLNIDHKLFQLGWGIKREPREGNLFPECGQDIRFEGVMTRAMFGQPGDGTRHDIDRVRQNGVYPETLVLGTC
jgi:hypothetical protein